MNRQGTTDSSLQEKGSLVWKLRKVKEFVFVWGGRRCKVGFPNLNTWSKAFVFKWFQIISREGWRRAWTFGKYPQSPVPWGVSPWDSWALPHAPSSYSSWTWKEKCLMSYSWHEVGLAKWMASLPHSLVCLRNRERLGRRRSVDRGESTLPPVAHHSPEIKVLIS